MSVTVRYAVKPGWGYAVKAFADDGACVWSSESGDCWDDLHIFGTGQMGEEALYEAAKFLAEQVCKAHGVLLEPILDQSLLFAEQ